MPTLEPEHAALVADLQQAGFQLDSVYDWVNGPAAVEAEEVLLRHLTLTTEPRTVEGIARALTQRGFKAAVPALLRKFGEVQEDSARWAIGNAIAYHGFSRAEWPLVLSYARDRRFGIGRQNLVWRLHRIKLPDVEPLLLDLINDLDVDSFAVMALAHCGSQESLFRLRALPLEGRTELMKREVPKTIARLELRYGAD